MDPGDEHRDDRVELGTWVSTPLPMWMK